MVFLRNLILYSSPSCPLVSCISPLSIFDVIKEVNFTVISQQFVYYLILQWTVDNGQMSLGVQRSAFCLCRVPVRRLEIDCVAFVDCSRAVVKSSWTPIQPPMGMYGTP